MARIPKFKKKKTKFVELTRKRVVECLLPTSRKDLRSTYPFFSEGKNVTINRRRAPPPLAYPHLSLARPHLSLAQRPTRSVAKLILSTTLSPNQFPSPSRSSFLLFGPTEKQARRTDGRCAGGAWGWRRKVNY